MDEVNMNISIDDLASFAPNSNPLTNHENDAPAFWLIVLWAALLGPFIAGLPWTWAMINTSFLIYLYIYIVGIGPALIGGMLFARWIRRGAMPSTLMSALFGAIFGGVGCFVCAALLSLIFVMSDDANVFSQASIGIVLFITAHGAAAGFVTGGIIAYITHQKAYKNGGAI